VCMKAIRYNNFFVIAKGASSCPVKALIKSNESWIPPDPIQSASREKGPSMILTMTDGRRIIT